MKYVIGCAEDYFNYCRDIKVNPYANREVVHLNSPQKISKMSLDLKLGDKEFNYTYNLSHVWYKCYPEADGMVDIEGLSGKDSQSNISLVIEMILLNYDEWVKENPDNGWGDLDSFYLWLCKLRLECIKQPNEIWEAFR
jgi:hypothetical protein